MGSVRGVGQLSRLIGAVRLTSVGHEHLVKYIVFPLAILVVDAPGVPYHRRGVSYQSGRCQVDAH